VTAQVGETFFGLRLHGKGRISGFRGARCASS
jgi:hypothetical protein